MTVAGDKGSRGLCFPCEGAGFFVCGFMFSLNTVCGCFSLCLYLFRAADPGVLVNAPFL